MQKYAGKYAKPTVAAGTSGKTALNITETNNYFL
jgi:hypothetical protein